MKLNKETVTAIFETSTNQFDALEDLYRLVYPDYSKIEKVNGHPRAGKEISKEIWRRFIAFDKIHHPSVMAGGCWLNYGFSTDETLNPWEISAEGVEVIYVQPENQGGVNSENIQVGKGKKNEDDQNGQSNSFGVSGGEQ